MTPGHRCQVSACPVTPPPIPPQACGAGRAVHPLTVQVSSQDLLIPTGVCGTCGTQTTGYSWGVMGTWGPRPPGSGKLPVSLSSSSNVGQFLVHTSRPSLLHVLPLSLQGPPLLPARMSPPGSLRKCRISPARLGAFVTNSFNVLCMYLPMAMSCALAPPGPANVTLFEYRVLAGVMELRRGY